MLQTLERTLACETRMLTHADRAALQSLCGPEGLPLLPPRALGPALQNGQILGDLAGTGNCGPPWPCCRCTPTKSCPPACGPPGTAPTARGRC